MIYFSGKALKQMMELVMGCDSEIGFQGCCERLLDGEDIRITDVFVYPQTVSAASIDTDEGKLLRWQMSLPDHVINSMRFHGHSHVYMKPFPSTVDKRMEKNRLAELEGDDEYYIFFIINKMGEYTCRYVDRAKQIDKRWEGNLFELKQEP